MNDASHLASPGSGASTPSSAGFVSLASLKIVDGLLKTPKKRSVPGPSRTPVPTEAQTASGAEENGRAGMLLDEEDDQPVYLTWDAKGLNAQKFAVLPNDWPYNVPYGVRHYCVWSRVGHSFT